MIQQLAELLHLSPDVVAIITALLPLIAAILHSRGNNLSVLTRLLNLLGAKQTPVNPATPADPAKPVDPPLPPIGQGGLIELIRRTIRDELKALQGPAEPPK